MTSFELFNELLQDGTDSEDCILWPLKTNAQGYPVIYRGDYQFLGHRLSLEIKEKRKLERNEFACHNRDCLHRHCINPKHLYIGSAKSNTLDTIAMGTWKGWQKGSGNVLTNEQAALVKSRLANGESRRSIARLFGVSKQTIQGIANGKTYLT